MILMVNAGRVLTLFKDAGGIKKLRRAILFTIVFISITSCYRDEFNNNQMEYKMSIDLLVQQIKTLNWDAPATAAGIGAPAAQTLSTLAKDEDPQIRQITIACLDAIGGENAVDIALEHLLDEDAEVVAESITLLHHHPPLKREEYLHMAFKKTKDPFAIEQIPLIAGRISLDINTKPWIEEMESQEKTGKVDDGLVTGLARMGHQPAREKFVKSVLASKGRRSKEWIDYCGYMEDTWIVPHMVPLLDRYELALNLNPDDKDSYLRTCDLAVEVIVELTGVDVGFPVKRVNRYTGQELTKIKEIALAYK